MNKSKNSNNVEKMQQEKTQYETKAFFLAIEIIFIFGIPALLAVWLGERFSGVIGGENMMTYVFLALAFILSWSIIFIRVRAIQKRLAEYRRKLQEAHTGDEDVQTE